MWKKQGDEKWTIDECRARWLCSTEGLGSPADEELTLTGKSQLGTILCLSFFCALYFCSYLSVFLLLSSLFANHF